MHIRTVGSLDQDHCLYSDTYTIISHILGYTTLSIMEDRVIWSGPKAIRSMLGKNLKKNSKYKNCSAWLGNSILKSKQNIIQIGKYCEVMSVASVNSDISWVVVWLCEKIICYYLGPIKECKVSISCVI